MSDKMLGAKSIHIFACPFKFGENAKSIKKTIKLMLSKGWNEKKMSFEAADSEEEKRESFMRSQYFNESARSIFEQNGENSPCFVLNYGSVEEYTYYIKTQEREYELEIGEIELHLYGCGVGILLIQVLNFEYQSLEDIKDINDYGRRISLPFLPGECPDILCAEQLGILKKDLLNQNVPTEKRWISVTDFRERIYKGQKLKREAEFITRIIWHALETPDNIDSQKVLEYCTDDRMYVLSVVRDNRLSKSIAEDAWDTEFLSRKTVKDSQGRMCPVPISAKDMLYQLIYVDNGAYTTCPNLAMRAELLRKAVYPRWSAWGTIHAVTAYSMLCITSENSEVNESVVRPFVVEYSYIFSLVLAQRFSIAKFSDRAGKSVTNINKEGIINRKSAKRLANLQEEYVAFKNKLLILQVTPQAQGVELYRLMQEQFLVHEEQAVLDEQLESLYEIVNTSNGNHLNNIALCLSIAAIILDVILTIIF